ncbi:hypothetical protein CRENBAI_004462 [Crenichthys baileyi]|uniref:Uncharacterized protein n=1 Tax=Crenichthys baileyi TaxID=28760 RepID=A0AAV9RL08_9TELE
MLCPGSPQCMQASTQPFNYSPHTSFKMSIMLMSGFLDSTREQKSSHSELGHQSRLSLCVSQPNGLLPQISAHYKHSDHELWLIHSPMFSPPTTGRAPSGPSLHIPSPIREAELTAILKGSLSNNSMHGFSADPNSTR